MKRSWPSPSGRLATVAAASAAARLRASKKQEALVDREAMKLFKEWQATRAATEAAKPPTPLGDVGVPPPPAQKGAAPPSKVDDFADLPGLDPDSSDSGTDSDSDSEPPPRGHKLGQTPAQATSVADRLRRLTAGAAPDVATQVNNVSAAELVATMHVHIERQRLIRWTREIGPCDPRINDHAIADKMREEYVLLVRSMQRPEFTAVEPMSGDRLQADLDYIDQHAQLPHMRIPLMRSCLVESIPESSAMEIMKQESEKRMAKFMKNAAGEAVRADSVRNLASPS